MSTTYEDYVIAVKRKLRLHKHTCVICHDHLSIITRTEQTLAGAIAEKRKHATRRLILAVEKLGTDLDSDLKRAKHHLDTDEHGS